MKGQTDALLTYKEPPKTISEAQAERIRQALRAHASAAEAFDPKRYKRGGGWNAAEMRKIEEMAGIPSPTDEQRDALRLYDFVHTPPERDVVYINEPKGNEWIGYAESSGGVVLGKVVFGREYKLPGFGMPSKRVPVTVYGVNGMKYVGTYFKSSGTYATIRRAKR